MNKKVIGIIILTLIALVLLTLFSFGPLAGIGKNAGINPASLKPQTTQPMPVNNKPIQFSGFHNKDIKENYYTLNLPQDWQVQSGQTAGSYSFTFFQGNGMVELMDVPDNTTLELFVLSQKEPELKKVLTNYVRKDYKKLKINNNEAYQLVFDSVNNGQPLTTVKIYIAGKDHAGVVTLNSKPDSLSALTPLFSTIINSFKWENNT